MSASARERMAAAESARALEAARAAVNGPPPAPTLLPNDPKAEHESVEMYFRRTAAADS